MEIRWPLAEDTAGSAARIEELVRTRASARSADANTELSELLRARVEEQLRSDPAQGYATALRAALDHRSWHTVEVYILGPTAGEGRRISRRARLSQGETRVVSYLALFAAADAFFAGLPDAEALRLILLDDAFAKVDERTIGELMAQLVRLDLDFVMTGHALWGFGPGVPSLDVYEVRRAEGTSAITTRVPWDGTSRHVYG
ncbi:SbcC/MukB-like Walker B domain-containing protein [Geodermatophilus sp. DF01_2]|uniref:SbcC/MukB-like Walker B domain-containing protein n=1 Tax=Geodermatophilus sp. DF01-2 TaxID=2559610 RepID=UPI001ADD6FF1|nr:SbcC/MukB-like Walker B domain-containing protein [Geodermatophilus sp. DF01_2]